MPHHSFDLESRLTRFSILVLNLMEQLPNTIGTRVLAHQLAKSATSVALNYGEVQANESPKDFIRKMSVCLKELRESQICLTMMKDKPYLPAGIVIPVLQECSELVAIFVSSIKTKRSNMQK